MAPIVCGLISDTHGLVRPEALAALAGVDRIIHAGDVGRAEVLEALARVAPVTAVRGNVDKGEWAEALPETATVRLGGVVVFVIHDVGELGRHALPEGCRVVVSGHSHKPVVAERDGLLFINPGSAGPRRFSLPVSMGRLVIEGGDASAELIGLEV